jgi:hypothetical protein
MRLFRYRRPSVKTMLGVTRAKKRIKRELGITALLRPFRWWTNQKRRVYRKVGYESEVGRFLRHGPRTPGGCLLILGMVLGATCPLLLIVGLTLNLLTKAP